MTLFFLQEKQRSAQVLPLLQIKPIEKPFQPPIIQFRIISAMLTAPRTVMPYPANSMAFFNLFSGLFIVADILSILLQFCLNASKYHYQP